MGIAEKHKIRTPGKIRIGHRAAILPDPGEGATDFRGTEICVARQDRINEPAKRCEAKCESDDNHTKLARSLRLWRRL